MAVPEIQSLVDLYADLYTVKWSDYDDGRSPGYLGRLLGPLQIEKKLPDLFFGISSPRQITFSVSNVDISRGTPGYGWGDAGWGDTPWGGVGDPTLAAINAAEKLKGKRIQARIRDLATSTNLFVFNGFITNVHNALTTGTVTAQEYHQDAFTELLPKQRILDVYPNADLTNATDADAPIIIPFGVMRKATLTLCRQSQTVETNLEAAASAGAATISVDAFIPASSLVILEDGTSVEETVRVASVSGSGPYTLTLIRSTVNAHADAAPVKWFGYDYGPIRTPSSGSLTINTVYRDKRIVGSTQYTTVTSIYGHTFIRFGVDQIDFSNRLMTIQADLTSTEFSYPSNVVKFLLSDTTYGLGKSVDATSFATAATDYSNLLYTVAGGLNSRQSASDIINKLLMHGAYLVIGDDGEYEITVDQVGLHVLHSVALGAGDGRWENLEYGSVSLPELEVSQTIKTLVIHGLYDPGFEGTGAYLLKGQRTRADDGVLREEFNPYIGDSATVDAEVDYNFKRLKYADKKLEARAQIEAAAIDPDDLASISIPNLFLHNTSMMVTGKSYEATKNDEQIEAWVRLFFDGYDSSIYTYTAGTVNTAPSANVLTDTTFTPPSTPTSFAKDSTATRLGTNGQVESVFNVSAVAPSSNCSHIVFRIYKAGVTFPIMEVAIPLTAFSATHYAALIATPGSSYDLVCFARNVANQPDYQDSPFSTLSSQAAADDTTAPAQVSGFALADHPPRGLKATWTANTEDDLDHYDVQTATDSGFTANVVTRTAYVNEIILGGLTNGTTYYGKVRAVDHSGNAGTYSTSANRATPRTATDDYTDDSVTAVKTSALSAAKITTGTLTVNGTVLVNVTGDNGIVINYGLAGPIIWKESGADRYEISCATVGSDVIFQILPQVANTLLRLGSAGDTFSALGVWSTSGLWLGSSSMTEASAPTGTLNRRLRVENESGTLQFYFGCYS